MIDTDRSFLSDTLAQLTTILDASQSAATPPPTEPRHAQPPEARSASAPRRRVRQTVAAIPPSGRPSAFTSPRRRDPARIDERTLFIVEDQVPHIRETACVADAPRLPADIAEQHRGVRLAVVVHEHQLLAELVLEVRQIPPRTLLDHRSHRRMTIAQPYQFLVVHARER